MAKRKRSRFTAEFKAKFVLDTLSGESSQVSYYKGVYYVEKTEFQNLLLSMYSCSSTHAFRY